MLDLCRNHSGTACRSKLLRHCFGADTAIPSARCRHRVGTFGIVSRSSAASSAGFGSPALEPRLMGQTGVLRGVCAVGGIRIPTHKKPAANRVLERSPILEQLSVAACGQNNSRPASYRRIAAFFGGIWCWYAVGISGALLALSVRDMMQSAAETIKTAPD